jgi:hypothetical protein
VRTNAGVAFASEAAGAEGGEGGGGGHWSLIRSTQ